MGFNYFIMRPWFALSDWRRDWRRRKTRVAAAAAAAARDLLAAWWLHTWFPEEQRGEVGPWIDHFFSGGREIKRIRPPHLPLSLSLVLRSTERDESRFFPPLEEKENFRYFFKEREREDGNGRKVITTRVSIARLLTILSSSFRYLRSPLFPPSRRGDKRREREEWLMRLRLPEKAAMRRTIKGFVGAARGVRTERKETTSLLREFALSPFCFFTRLKISREITKRDPSLFVSHLSSSSN